MGSRAGIDANIRGFGSQKTKKIIAILEVQEGPSNVKFVKRRYVPTRESGLFKQIAANVGGIWLSQELVFLVRYPKLTGNRMVQLIDHLPVA